MHVPFINLSLQYKYFRKEILKKFDKISKSGNYILGRELELFEKTLQNFAIQNLLLV